MSTPVLPPVIFFASLILLPVVPAPPTICNTIDAVFVFDSSESITLQQFEKVKAYAINYAQMFSSATTQIGGVVYAKEVYQTWNLNAYSDQQDIIAVISNIRYDPDTTNTANALVHAGDVLLGPGTRPLVNDHCRSVMLFSDGQLVNQNRVGVDPIAAADNLRKAPIFAQITCIEVEGVDSANYTTLLKIAGNNPRRVIPLR